MEIHIRRQDREREARARAALALSGKPRTVREAIDLLIEAWGLDRAEFERVFERMFIAQIPAREWNTLRANVYELDPQSESEIVFSLARQYQIEYWGLALGFPGKRLVIALETPELRPGESIDRFKVSMAIWPAESEPGPDP